MRCKRPEPVLTKRAGELGWIASTPLEYPLRFAVCGQDEEEARWQFGEAVARWEALGENVTEETVKRYREIQHAPESAWGEIQP